MNISSLVINAKPELLEEIIQAIDSIEGAECHQHNALGKIIATIEADEISNELKILKKIESIRGVLSADMVYSYSEELEQERSKIEIKNAQEILNNPSSQHRYGGSVALKLDEALSKK